MDYGDRGMRKWFLGEGNGIKLLSDPKQRKCNMVAGQFEEGPVEIRKNSKKTGHRPTSRINDTNLSFSLVPV